MKRLVIAGTGSGVGKTTIATGLMAAFTAAGRDVAGFKAGPDFIDPSYHALATPRGSTNLDAFLCGEDLIAPMFVRHAAGSDIAVVEGVMGLFDGVTGTEGVASTGHVAKLIDAPVVLVVDASSMGRSVAAVVHGFTTFDPEVRIAGVIANRVGSDRHARIVRDALDRIGVPVLGAIPRDDALGVPSRHLGLIPAGERRTEAEQTVAAMGRRITNHLDLGAIERLAAAPALPARAWEPPHVDVADRPTHRPTIAVAAGAAFTFSYPEHADILRAAGAEVVLFDPVSDEHLPAETRGVVIGGGFPEQHAEALAANAPLRRQIASFRGPIVAECGGLLYLGRSLDGHDMCGVINTAATMSPRLVLGYREAEAAADSVIFSAGTKVRAHEFHRTITTPAAGANAAWHVDGRAEGFADRRLHASYLHTHWAATPSVAQRLVEAAR